MALENWNIDTVHSTIGFTVRHLMVSKVHGLFTKWEGTFAFDEEKPASSRVEVKIDVASVDTREPQRDAHLRTCYAACGIGSYWGCVGRVSRPIAKDRNILFTVTLVDSAQRTGLAGLAVKACEVGDGACSSPLASGTTDAKGTVTLPLTVQPSTAYGFQGFLDISSPAIVPYLFFLSFSLSEPHASIELPLLTTAGLANLVSLAGVTLDPARGHLAAVANDCLLNGAPNVVVDADGIDATTQRRYLDGSFLSSSATTTDRSGLVFFLNAPPTAIALRATPRAIDRVSGRASVFVRAGTLSLVQVNPSP